MKPLTQRRPGYDNLRGFLILCVVLGHVLEICPPFQHKELLYRVIYSFHMGAFLFLFGRFARFDPKRILRGYLLPYVLFQILYILFLRHCLDLERKMQFTTPYWILWYLLACVFYQLLIPFFGVGSPRRHLAYLIGSVVLALLAGYDTTVSYYATVSRFFVYLPWFLLGYYSRQYEAQLRPYFSRRGYLLLAGCALVVVFSIFYLHEADFPRDALYGSYPYEKKGYGLPDRLMFLLTGLAWLGLLWKLFTGLLDRQIPLLTTLGQNTLPVFLLHGFVIKVIPKHYPWVQQLPGFVLWLPAMLLLLFGNPLVGTAFRAIFTPTAKKGGKS